MSFVLTLLKYILLALAIALFAAYKWNSRVMTYWKRKGFPYLPPLPLVGNYLDALLARTSISEMYEFFYHQMSDERYFGIYITTQPALIIKDPELIMRIMVKDFNYFYDRGFHVDDNDFLGGNLFFNRNPKWKQQRSKVMPVFSSAKLKFMSELINHCCKDIIDYMDSLGEIIPSKTLTAEIFTDIVCKVVCGIELNTLKNMNKEYVRMQGLAFAPSVRNKVKSFLNFASPYLGKKVFYFPSVLYDYYSNLVLGTAKLRKEKHIRRNDVLQFLIEIHEKEQMLPPHERVLDKNDLVGAIFIFILAGYETSLATSSITLNELAHDKSTQDRVRQQLVEIYEKNDRKFDYEQLKEMTLLEQAISESIRLYPLTNALFRQCMEDYPIPGTNHVIEKNTIIHIPTLALHKDPKYWTDPEKYDIDRFSKENISKIVPGTYLGFGDGPRICIGKRFAFLQLKLVLANIIINYEISPCQGSTKKPTIQRDTMLGSPVEDLVLKFTKIKH